MDDIENAERLIGSWQLGQTSARHETNGLGAGAISTGKGDHGGVSYGIYQLSSKMGTVKTYVAQSRYKDNFDGMTPATPAFDAKWIEIAMAHPDFGQDQHDFIKRTHYDIQVAKLKSAGIDLSDRGRAVQDELWSTSVQFGGKTDVIQKGMEDKFGAKYDLSKISDDEIIEAVQDYKSAKNNRLFKSSPDLLNSLMIRAEKEKHDLINLNTNEKLLARNGIDIPMPLSPDAALSRETTQRHVDHASTRTLATKELQKMLNALGYRDIHNDPLVVDGHYGKRTQEVVETFQHGHNLTADGIAGPNTWAALRKATQAQSLSDSPKVVPELDAPLIRTLQQHLIKPGSDTPQNPAAPPLSAEPVVTPPSHADDTNQQLAMLQAQLREMQRQMEAMNRERNAEREKDEARTAPSDVIQHDAQPSRQADNDHATVGYSDPRHPVHPLYVDVKQRLESQDQHLPEDRLTQVVGEMHMRKFQPNWDGYVKVQGDKLCAGDYHPWGGFVTLDLKQPAPPVQETLLQVDNHQQALAQEQMLRAQQTPSLGHGHALSR